MISLGELALASIVRSLDAVERPAAPPSAPRGERCRKQQYGDLTDALRALSFWKRDPRTSDPASLTIYRCRQCGDCWHLGHTSSDAEPQPRAVRQIVKGQLAGRTTK